MLCSNDGWNRKFSLLRVPHLLELVASLGVCCVQGHRMELATLRLEIEDLDTEEEYEALVMSYCLSRDTNS